MTYDSLDGLQSSASTPRCLLDIELCCKDGVVMASSHLLASNSVVFEKMLFSVVQMEESKTNIVHIDDVSMADMVLLLNFYEFRVLGVVDYFNKLEAVRLVYLISISHRYEFTGALGVLCDCLAKAISVPTSAELQFADTLHLESVLRGWSVNCKSPKFYYTFVNGLGKFPLSEATLRIFSKANMDSVLFLHQTRCMDLCIFNAV